MRVSAVALAVTCAAVTTAGTADAKRPPPRDIDILDDRPLPPVPCTSGKTWTAISACLAKQSLVELLYDSDAVKIVRARSTQLAKTSQLYMYTLREKQWVRAGFYAMTSSVLDTLTVTTFPTPIGDGIRLDVDSSMRSVFSTGPGVLASVGLVRRTNSTVCTPSTWTCRSALTSCDAYTRGRLLWTFHGDLYWHASLGIRLRGDATHAGGSCQPPAHMLDAAETP